MPYICIVNGVPLYFDTCYRRDVIAKVVKAAKQHLRVRVRYFKLTTGKLVLRTIAAYEIKGDSIFVTDTKHGNKSIRAYKLANIRSAVITNKKFKPEWEIKL